MKIVLFAFRLFALFSGLIYEFPTISTCEDCQVKVPFLWFPPWLLLYFHYPIVSFLFPSNKNKFILAKKGFAIVLWKKIKRW